MPFTIVATGFSPGSQVYAEQCDGNVAERAAVVADPRLRSRYGNGRRPRGFRRAGDVRRERSQLRIPPISWHESRELVQLPGRRSGLDAQRPARFPALHRSGVDEQFGADTRSSVLRDRAPPAPALLRPRHQRERRPRRRRYKRWEHRDRGIGAPRRAKSWVRGRSTGALSEPTRTTGRLAFTGRWTLGLAAVGFECIAVGPAFSESPEDTPPRR